MSRVNTNHPRPARRRRMDKVTMAVAFVLFPTVVFSLVPPRTLMKVHHNSASRSSYCTMPPRMGLFSSTYKKQEKPKEKATTTPTTLKVDSSSSSSSSAPFVILKKNPKLKMLKDKMWVREAKEDVTAAEFACSLADDGGASSGQAPLQSEGIKRLKKKQRKRAVDYENLLTKLESHVLDLCCETLDNCPVQLDDETLVPSPNGKGSIIFTTEQRQALLQRILRTRHALVETMEGHELDFDNDDDSPFNIQFPEIRVDIPKDANASSTSLSDQDSDDSLLYVRDDGTVDWDGALQDRAALKKFGTAVWSRINGQDPDEMDNGEEQSTMASAFRKAEAKKPPVTAKIEETKAIRMEKERLDELMEEYNEMKIQHTALLNSAISAGQAVANINLATLDPKLRKKIRLSTETLEKKEEQVSFQTLMYELERIYTYLDGEMSSKGYIPLQDRLNVAEFGLLESQIESLNSQMETGEIVDPDVLAVVLDQLTDFKRRLGIDYFVTGLTFDRQAILQWLNELGTKTKAGLAFYVKGCRLFWNDIVFGLSLVGRALRGYTLKPREVRNLRRTVKDIVTFVPVVIILIIPLSPVGHVLVFGAIQRFFPGFFPSCFTESRQNLLQLYESTEYSEVTINETWQEKLSRLSEALVFLLANFVRKIYTKLRGEKDDPVVNDAVSSPEEGGS